MTIRATKLVAALALAALPHTGSAADATLRFLEARVQADPLDITAHNRLASLYFRPLRDTGDLPYLDRAANEARASPAAVPAEQNGGGPAAAEPVAFASH